jgi:hypothetical protein
MSHLARILAALFVVTYSGAALAQSPPCTKRADIVQHLQGKYSESPVAMGIANNGGVLEVLSSKANGTWTIIITMPNGTSCMIAAGDSWVPVPKTMARKGPTT